MQRLREHLTLFLLAFLPFHAFFVTFWTRILAGPGYAPLWSLAVWKEVILGVILLLALWEVNQKRETRNQQLRLDLPDLLILALLGLVLMSFRSPIADNGSRILFLLGFKYTLLPLLVFFVLRRVRWGAAFRRRLLLALLFTSVTVSVYALLTMLLPMGFFRFLGYSDLHSTYVPGGPVAAFQLLSDSVVRRVQGPMAGPNQLGLYLLLPWSLGILFALSGGMLSVGARGKFWNKVRLAFSSWLHSTSPLLQSLQPYLFAIGIGGALFLTFSRSAWVAAVAIVLVAAASLRRDLLLRSVPILSACFAAFLLLSVVAPSVVLRTTSADHLRRPLEAMKILLAEPYGRGLGAAGPAQHRVSDVCLHYPLGSDTSWAKARPDLCVYRGGIQVQPRDRDCRCPVIPENWYLQIGMELGVLGLVLYLILMYALLRNLLKLSTDHLSLTTSVTALFLLGVSVAGLFLHSFEDSAVAYTVWVLAAVALPRKKM